MLSTPKILLATLLGLTGCRTAKEGKSWPADAVASQNTIVDPGSSNADVEEAFARLMVTEDPGGG